MEVTGIPTGMLANEAMFANEAMLGFLSSPMVSLPRLTEFAVNRIVDDFCYGRAPQCEFLMPSFILVL